MRKIALPVEHGGWGFLLEPIVLAMLVAPTSAGACYSAGAVATFLLRHPLKLFLNHRGQLATSRRYRIAARVALAYATLAAAGFGAAVWLGGWVPAIPLVLLGPLTVTFVLYDAQNKGRKLIPELSGPLGLAALAPAIALAAGWSADASVALWVVSIARTIPSIFYIRARIRFERGRPIRRAPVIGYHLIALSGVALLAWRGLSPFLPALGMFVLILRAAVGLSPYRRLTRVKQIGILEVFFGLVYVLIAAAGYLLDV